MDRSVTFNTNSSITPVEWNTQWDKNDLRKNSQTKAEFENSIMEKKNEDKRKTFNKYGNFGDGNGTQTWMNTNENKYVNRDTFNRSDPFFNPYHQDTEKEILRNYNLTSSTGASRDDWRKYGDIREGDRIDWNDVGEEINYPSDNRRNCNGNGNGESCTISGGKKTRRNKYRKNKQIKRKTKRHIKTKKYHRKKYSKRR